MGSMSYSSLQRFSWLFATIVLMPLMSLPTLGAPPANGTLRFFWTDVEGGAATLAVTPAGESILIDAGMPGDRDPPRIARTLKKVAGLKQVDHLVVTHFDIDHYGGTADLAKLVPIKKVYDPGLPAGDPGTMRRIRRYIEVTRNKRRVMRPGDTIQLKPAAGKPGSPQLTVRCLAANKKFLSERKEKRNPNPHCAEFKPKAPDESQNANSIVLLFNYGDFTFFAGGDLTWNLEHALVCPHNPAGKVDVFQIGHHGLSSSNSPVLLKSLAPRVVIMNNGARKGCSPETFATLQATRSIKAVFQLHRNIRVGPGGNTTRERIANWDQDCAAEIVQLAVAPDGKKYTVGIPSTGHREVFESRSEGGNRTDGSP